jgi:rubredoxin
MKKLFRCKKCKYNYLASVADPQEGDKKTNDLPAEQKCPKCGTLAHA